MAHIRIDTDAVLQQAANINKHSQTYSGLGSRVNSITGQMTASWKGESATAYIEMMQKYMQQGEYMKNVLDLFSRLSTEVTNDILDADQKSAAAIRNSF